MRHYVNLYCMVEVASRTIRYPSQTPFFIFFEPDANIQIERRKERRREKTPPPLYKKVAWLASQMTCGYAGQPVYINDPNPPLSRLLPNSGLKFFL